MVEMKSPQEMLDRLWRNKTESPDISAAHYEVSQLLANLLAALVIVDPIYATDDIWEKIDFPSPPHYPSGDLGSFLTALRNGLAHRQWEPQNGGPDSEFTAIEFWTIYTTGINSGKIKFRCPLITKEELMELFDLLTTMDDVINRRRHSLVERQQFTAGDL